MNDHGISVHNLVVVKVKPEKVNRNRMQVVITSAILEPTQAVCWLILLQTVKTIKEIVIDLSM